MITKERLYKATHEKNGVQRYIARRMLFPVFEWLGFHIVGDHFYEPIPNTKDLRHRYPPAKARTIEGIAFDFQAAENRLAAMLGQYGPEFREAAAETDYPFVNNYFSLVDAICLYAFIRERKPARIVEIGQGASTLATLAALARNGRAHGTKARFVSVDPYSRIPVAVKKLESVEFTCIQKAVQTLSAGEAASVTTDVDFLFIDSSHIFKPCSDVEYIMRDLMPRVRPGCDIHVHDIYTPYPRPLELYLGNRTFWDEQDHLESFLCFNNQYRVDIPVYWLVQDSTKVRGLLEKHLGAIPFRSTSFYLSRKPSHGQA